MILSTKNNYPADRGRRYTSIETAASVARGLLGYSPDEPLPRGVWLLERLAYHPPVVVRGRAYDVVWEAKPTSRGVEAHTRFEPDDERFVIRIDPETYVALESRDDPRQRFGVCHELGHVHLHAPELVRMTELPVEKLALNRARAKSLPVFQNTEWQAEAFGAAFMVPAVALLNLEQQYGSVPLDVVQRRFGVSYSAASARLRVWCDPKYELKEVARKLSVSESRRATVGAVAQ